MKFLLAALISLPLLVHAQGDTVRVKRYDIVRGIDGLVYTAISPARWKGKDWLTFGGVIAGSAVLTLLDEPVHDLFKNRTSDPDVLHALERAGFHYGKPYSAVAFTGGFYLAGLILKNEWAKETGLMLATSISAGAGLQTILKTAVGRARPDTGLGRFEGEFFSDQPHLHSFPSGHTTVALSISLVMARQIDIMPVKIFFYSLATLTAASRLYVDAHWLSDIVLGGGIGWFCTDAAIKRIQANRFRLKTGKAPVALSVYPYPGGISLKCRI